MDEEKIRKTFAHTNTRPASSFNKVETKIVGIMTGTLFMRETDRSGDVSECDRNGCGKVACVTPHGPFARDRDPISAPPGLLLQRRGQRFMRKQRARAFYGTRRVSQGSRCQQSPTEEQLIHGDVCCCG
jgi:hypothetical protein